MLRTILTKIGEGLLIGVGVGITVGVFMYVQSRWAMAEFEDKAVEMATFENYGPDAKLSIKSHRPQQSKTNSVFIGEVANEGAHAWNYVQIVVELFDNEGKFVGKCSNHLEGSIGPGQTRNFEVSCASCRNTPTPLYDKYTVAVVDASFVHSGSEV